MDRLVHAPDGRVLAVEDAGDPAGSPVLVHNGTPMSRHLYGPNVADAAERGLRLISYAAGSQGWWDDSYGLIRPWGFDLADISAPVLLLHGRQDKFVPFAHGQWLATHIPGVEARMLEDDGHLTLQEHRVSEVHCWLMQHL